MNSRFAEFLARLRGAGTSDARDRQRMASILALSRSLAAADDRGTVLRLLLDESVELFRAERGFLIEVNPSSGEFRVAFARNLDREPIQHAARKISSTIVKRCIASREGVFVEDAQDGDLSAAASIADLQLRSVMCIPLSAGDTVHGCLYLDHRFHAGVFLASDLPWVQALADQGAIALRLHDLLAAEAERARVAEHENEHLVQVLADRDRELESLHGDLQRSSLEHEYPQILGESVALLRFLRMLDRVSAVDLAVLLIGESGTGKELAARAIWENSRRRGGRFVAINVAAMSPAILESELFGHVRGAFTGADIGREGVIRHAAGGVLFLDEVTEMPLEMQVKLLRFLEDHCVRPVGSDATYEVDLRVIAASNRDPEAAVADGSLREDLYYRLSAMTVHVPSLRERLSDVPLLVDAFFAAAARERGAAESPRRAGQKLLDALKRRAWPGNLRQLRNEVFRLDAMASGDVVDQMPPAESARLGAAAMRGNTLELRELEQWAIGEALRATGGNKAEAARLLGISRRALYNKLERNAEP